MIHPEKTAKDTQQTTTSSSFVAGVVMDEQYPIHLDEVVTLDELMCTADYDSCIADVDELERIFAKDPRTQDVVLEPICFESACTLERMLEEMASKGYRPATLRELLGVGAQHPELQRRKVLVALGSINNEAYIHSSSTEWSLNTVTHIPVLADVLGERMFILGEYDGKYRPGYYFLCVKIPKNGV
ncbi:MAG: hypothetical protein KBD21_04145 [Candidatus Pacebacteria bacterium]|nr:hypothetical protein [Candidatus Paceibacterota bacterium]